MTAQVAADLRAAAEVLRRDGWTQGNFHLPDGCHCVQGAIGVATGYHLRVRPVRPGDWHMTWDEPAGDEYDRYLRAVEEAEEYRGTNCLWEWNDHPDRTADEVIAALLAAADRAEATS